MIIPLQNGYSNLKSHRIDIRVKHCDNTKWEVFMNTDDGNNRSGDVVVKRGLLGPVAMVAVVISWGFNFGFIPWFGCYGVVWASFLVLSGVAAFMSRKTMFGKMTMGLLLLEAISYPILHGASMGPILNK